ncbi:MAG: hypothetical protein D8H95_00780 [Lachnospiraceae bacterium]|nr:MAG: hypothetical protein D8H95_00780 [Lachnospiraceae bacterium]
MSTPHQINKKLVWGSLCINQSIFLKKQALNTLFLYKSSQLTKSTIFIELIYNKNINISNLLILNEFNSGL